MKYFFESESWVFNDRPHALRHRCLSQYHRLKMRSGIICADLESFRAVVQSAFDEKDKPFIVFLNAGDVFDYKAL